MGYGHPHEVELYTYKWVGDTIELVEYIYPHPDESQRGTFVKSNYLLAENDSMDWLILNNIPAAYRQVEAADWMIAD